jgi:long-chain fatty acid transport protein
VSVRRPRFGCVAAFGLSSLVTLASSGSARASGITEFPDNGSEQLGRGGAWVARASDPLAAFYNPAGLAGQHTRVTVSANLTLAETCFQRVAAQNDQSIDPLRGMDGSFPTVCNNGGLFPNPQLAVGYRVNDRLGVALALLGPSGVGSTSWPDFVDREGKPYQPGSGTAYASPQRYLMLSADALFLTPTLAFGYEVADGVRLGAGVQWGVATFKFASASNGLNQSGQTPEGNDLKSELSGQDLFVPGATLGAMWSPSDWVDVAGWMKVSDSISGAANVRTQANAFSQSVANGDTSRVKEADTSTPNCGVTNGPPVCEQVNQQKGGVASVSIPVPMEIKLGVRYHQPRHHGGHVRDPMAQDKWDAEVDFTFANNRAFDRLAIGFPSDPANPSKGLIPAAVVPGEYPPNADVIHAYKNVFGVRVGGDWNVVPARLALRAGGFFETNGQDARYQNIDFMGAWRLGFALGATWRIPVGRKSAAFELSAGFMHMFVGDRSFRDRSGTSGLPALAGTPCNPTVVDTSPTCPNGQPKYRTNWPVNLGTISSSLSSFNVGVAYRF